ncbi:hypothetical protein VTO73DRAFT_12267 [Trametes versicolor]
MPALRYHLDGRHRSVQPDVSSLALRPSIARLPEGPAAESITDSATNNMPITMQFPNIAEHNLLWPTNVLGGTVAVFEVTDATGETAFSGAVNVQPSPSITMKTITSFFAVAAVFVSAFAADPLVLNTPGSVAQCVPTEITWTGGTRKCLLLVRNSLHPLTRIIPQLRSICITDSAVNNMPTTEDFPGLTGNSFLWDTDVLAVVSDYHGVGLLAGTVMTMKLTDAAGVTAFSAPVVVQQSQDTSCL